MVSLNSHLLPLVAILVLFPAIASIVDATIPVPDFITKSCNATRHPQLCSRTLAPFLGAVKKDDLRSVNEQASTLAFSVARRVFRRITRISRELNASTGVDPKVINAVNLCMEYHESADKQIELAVTSAHDVVTKAELENPEGTFDDADYGLSLASAALGDCLKQWDNLPNSKIKNGICRPTRKVQNFAGNAKDLFASLRSQVIAPVSPPPANCPKCLICCSSEKLPPGQCCEKCCDPEPLPSQQVPFEVMVKQMCPDPTDLSCIDWVKSGY
ncbi:hypothetical protein ACHQM5_013651 [Ranunculus cassubicifolius]